MADGWLQGVIDEANRGAAVPAIRVVAGNTLFVGTPGPTGDLAQRTVNGLAEEYFNQRRVKRKDAERVSQEMLSLAEETAAALIRSASRVDDHSEVLTLLDCEVWPASGGDGARVPLVRIPIESIDGWWPGTGQRLKAGQGGGWLVGFGVVLPVEGG